MVIIRPAFFSLLLCLFLTALHLVFFLFCFVVVIFKLDIFSFLTSSVKVGLKSNNSWLEQNSTIVVRALKSWKKGSLFRSAFLLLFPE